MQVYMERAVHNQFFRILRTQATATTSRSFDLVTCAPRQMLANLIQLQCTLLAKPMIETSVINNFGPFNTREVASVVWVLVFVTWAFRRLEVRNSFSSVVKCALHWKIVSVFCLAVSWTGLMACALYLAGFWNYTLLKDTLAFGIFSSVSSAARSVSTKTPGELFAAMVRDSISVAVILEFISNAYTFGIWAELFLIIPLSLLLTLLSTVSASHTSPAIVAKFFKCLQAIWGLILLVLIGMALSRDTSKVTSIDAGRQFLLPLLLGFLNLPFLYAISLMSSYERLYIRFRMGTLRPFYVRFYGLLKLMDYLRLDLAHANASLSRLSLPLIDAQSHDDIDCLIRKDRKMLEEKAAILAWRRERKAWAESHSGHADPVSLGPIFNDPWRASEFVLSLGLSDSKPGDPAWRGEESDWYSLAKLVIPKSDPSNLVELTNEITCMHSSRSADRVEWVRWRACVWNQPTSDLTFLQFKVIYLQYLEALGWPFPQEIVKVTSPEIDKRIENEFAIFEWKYIKYALGHEWQLIITSKGS